MCSFLNDGIVQACFINSIYTRIEYTNLPKSNHSVAYRNHMSNGWINLSFFFIIRNIKIKRVKCFLVGDDSMRLLRSLYIWKFFLNLTYLWGFEKIQSINHSFICWALTIKEWRLIYVDFRIPQYLRLLKRNVR